VSVSGGERAYKPTLSIEQLFHAFSNAASIRIDPLARHIVSVHVFVVLVVVRPGGEARGLFVQR
jgi:hypothetical protein